LEVVLNHSPTALLVATMDTKGQEALFVAQCLRNEQISVLILDAGIRGKSPVATDISRDEVAAAGGETLAGVQNIGHEGEALRVMTAGAIKCAQKLERENKIDGIIGLGGSMGTTLGTAVMRAFPVGVPKVMITTMASRDTRAFVGTKDILMLHAVCDLAGLNRITHKILSNGAGAMAGMLGRVRADTAFDRPLVFLSTLGTTEACVQDVRHVLEGKGKEVVIFHTVGSGGAAMEEMIEQEEVAAVIDLSLHEIADHHFDGDYDAGSHRGWAAPQKGIPTILVPGNIDFLVSGPLEAAKRQFPGRTYHVHNAAITVVRTNHEEIKKMARIVAELANRSKGPLRILVPLNGFSAFDSPQGPLPDPQAPELFAQVVQENLANQNNLKLLPHHINDPEFSRAIIEAFDDLLQTAFDV
jgi:uncharacterized protein (UPF0261 family)